MKSLDVEPSLGELGNEEVEGLHDVLSDLFLLLGLDGDGGGQPGALVGLEGDGSHLALDLFRDDTGLGDLDGQLLDGRQQLSDGLDDLLVEVGRHEDTVVLTGPLLDGLFVLGFLLDVVELSEGDLLLDAFVSVGDVGDNHDLGVRPGKVLPSGCFSRGGAGQWRP